MSLPSNYINRLGRDDPLKNPRRVYWTHYDNTSIMGRWGELLARTLRLKTSDERWYRAVQANLKANRDGSL